MPDLEDTVRVVVELVLGLDRPDHDLDLIASGLLDSMSLINIVVELEDRLGLDLPFASFEIDDFRSVRSLQRLVQSSVASA